MATNFVLNPSQYRADANMLLGGGAYLRFLAQDQKGPQVNDPRSKLDKLRDGLRDIFRTSDDAQQVYRACTEAAGRLQPLASTVMRGVDRRTASNLVQEIGKASPKDRKALRALVTLYRAYGVLPIDNSRLEAHAPLVESLLIENSVKSLERLRFEGAARFLGAAMRFSGVEKRVEILPGVLVALRTWLPLVSEDVTPEAWNKLITLLAKSAEFQRDVSAPYSDVHHDITASTSMAWVGEGSQKVVEAQATSYLLEALRPFIEAGLLPPVGASVESIGNMFNGYNRVRKDNFGIVSLERREVEEPRLSPVTKSDVQMAFESAVKGLRNARNNLSNDQVGYQEFVRRAEAFDNALTDALANANLRLNDVRVIYIAACMELAQTCYEGSREGNERINDVVSVDGVLRGFLADMSDFIPVGSDAAYSISPESWEAFLTKMSTTSISRQPGAKADTKKAAAPAAAGAVNPNDPDAIEFRPDATPTDNQRGSSGSAAEGDQGVVIDLGDDDVIE